MSQEEAGGQEENERRGGGGGEELRKCSLLRGKVEVKLKVSFEDVHFYEVKLG